MLAACWGRVSNPGTAGTQVCGERGQGQLGHVTAVLPWWGKEFEYFCCFLFVCISSPSLALDIRCKFSEKYQMQTGNTRRYLCLTERETSGPRFQSDSPGTFLLSCIMFVGSSLRLLGKLSCCNKDTFIPPRPPPPLPPKCSTIKNRDLTFSFPY